VIRRIVVALLLCAAVAAAADEPPRFFIESIDVRGSHRVSRDVIAAESRLRTGGTYSEAELREAAARVTRAPYLLSADFSLEKGTERGRYILVITVNETKPFFYRLDLVPIVPVGVASHIDINTVALASDNDIALGVRFFVGRRGELHAGFEAAADNRSYTSDYASFVAGYTQYDVFGTRAFVTLNAKRPEGVIHADSRIVPQLVAGIPLSINQTITLEYDPTEIRSDGGENHPSISQRVATVRWSFNTTNHPQLPTLGTYLTVAPIVVWHDASGKDFVLGKPSSPYVTHDRSVGLEASANRWWELSHRISVGTGVAGGYNNLEIRGFRQSLGLDGVQHATSRFGALSFSAAHSFWPAARAAKEGDSRIQVDARLATRSEERGARYSYQSGNVKQVSASWIRRTSWGLVRLGAGYGW
jgi:hypothetical protein